MGGELARLDEKVAALEAAAADCRAATREAHEAIKALKQQEKQIRDLLDDEIDSRVAALISSCVKTGLDQYGETIRKAQDEAFDRVCAAFEELGAIYVAGHKNELSLPELAEKRLAAIRSIRDRGPRG